jgi:hypothetical protein
MKNTPLNPEFTPEKKLELERQISVTLLDAIDRGDYSTSEIGVIAREIYPVFHKVHTMDDFLLLLDEISHHWPIFKNMKVQHQAQIEEVKQQVVLDKLSTFFKTAK